MAVTKAQLLAENEELKAQLAAMSGEISPNRARLVADALKACADSGCDSNTPKLLRELAEKLEA